MRRVGHGGRRRAAALGRHGAGAGLLLQQVARRLLRADRVPHRLAPREPPARVHGGAHLLRDEHEGQGAVLRRRVRRARDRGAAARRERVAGRLRRRRGEDPLRPQRGEERRRGDVPRDRRGARGGRAVRLDLGLHRARRPVGREQARRSSRSSCAARSTRPARRARGCSRCSRTRSPTARSSSRTGCSARPRSSTSATRPPPRPRHHASIPEGEFEKAELLRMEKESLGLYVSEHPLSAIRDQLRRKHRLHARGARAAARGRDRPRRRHRLRRCGRRRRRRASRWRSSSSRT